MRRSNSLKRLIWQITGQTYEVQVKRRLPNNYGAITDNAAKVVEICESQLENWPLIWHEMGHISCDQDGQTLFQAEYAAQLWALKQLLKRKDIQVFEESLQWMEDWVDKDAPKPSDEIYYKVKLKIFRALRTKGLWCD